ncbi:hypothetical protein T4D_2292 [Trichinella pseudospiralis]|uniref:C2H2-type domain-containing protein n=1 Tax=Trichinella pseudospiralis TaxID=6337 RepID=A0A0V1F8J3_TRIPS|nr:hypothetical protein T4D_2292 [Trichinella pseudospiralis]
MLAFSFLLGLLRWSVVLYSSSLLLSLVFIFALHQTFLLKFLIRHSKLHWCCSEYFLLFAHIQIYYLRFYKRNSKLNFLHTSDLGDIFAMDSGRNFQSRHGANSLSSSDPEKQCRKPPPPGAVAAAAAAIAAAAATAAGKDLRPKFVPQAKLKHRQEARSKSSADIIKHLHALSAYSNSSTRSLEQPSTSNDFRSLDLKKKTAQFKPPGCSSTNCSSSQAYQATAQRHDTTHKRKCNKLPPNVSTDTFSPDLNTIPSSHLKIPPRAPATSDSPQINSSEANLNVLQNAAASNLLNLLGHITPSSGMPIFPNPYHFVFPMIGNYPLFVLQQTGTGNQHVDVRSAEQALGNNQVMMPFPFPYNVLQHPFPFLSALASYNAGMQQSLQLLPLLSYFQQIMNFPNSCNRDISSTEPDTISKNSFSPNLCLATKLLISALEQADNYIIGRCRCSICDLCGEKFTLYVLFMEHITVHCCKILENEKHNFVIWNSFAADYLSVVESCIPKPCDIMLAMEQQRSLQNPTSSNIQQSNPMCSQTRKRKASNRKKNKGVTESDGKSISATLEGEQENRNNETRANSEKQKFQMPPPESTDRAVLFNDRCMTQLLKDACDSSYEILQK